MPDKFRALIVYEKEDGTADRRIETRSIDDLPEGEVLVRVEYSSLNFKDGLSASIHHGITRSYPHTPGIDAAGVVAASSDPEFSEGDRVIVTGYDLGMNTSGGFGEYIRVPSDWVVPTPENLTSAEAMTYGTAGFTAALSVYRLERHGLRPDAGDVVVTGATGGVGSMGVMMLAASGYRVTASTGKLDQRPYLESLGAVDVIDRDEVNDRSGKPLLARRWVGAIDTVGGEPLSRLLAAMDYEGGIATCGNVAGNEFTTTVYPLILRGAALIGINTSTTPNRLRRELWNRMARDWKPDFFSEMGEEVPLENLEPEIEAILKGERARRVVVRVSEG